MTAAVQNRFVLWRFSSRQNAWVRDGYPQSKRAAAKRAKKLWDLCAERTLTLPEGAKPEPMG